MTHWLSLDDPAAADPASVGGKAATLARLRREGLPVPSGRVLPAAAAAALPDNGALAASLGPLLVDLPGPVAVRSSAVEEDGQRDSYAGQLDSLLSVQGVDAVADAVRAVVRSGSSPRVLQYAGRAARVAVLVQPMVDARAAGVAFSADPVTGDRDVVMISAVPGLCDRLVAGLQEGEHWRVDDRAACADPRVLSPDDARTIAALARRAEDLLGCAVDIEWALVDDQPVLLQARPITALPVPPSITIPPGSFTKDVSHYPSPISPYAGGLLPRYDAVMATVFAEFGLLVDGGRTRAIGHEVYFSLVPPGGGDASGPTPPWWLLPILAALAPPLRKKVKAAKAALSSGLSESVLRSWETHDRAALLNELAALRAQDLTTLSDPQLLAWQHGAFDLLARAGVVHFRLFMPYVQALHQLAMACEDLLGWGPEQQMRLLGGLSTASSAPSRDLADLATRVRRNADANVLLADPDRLVEALSRVAPALGDALQAWIDTYGHRVLGYECGCPTLAEQPALVGRLLAGARVDGTLEQGRQQAVAEARGRLSSDADRSRFDAALAVAERWYPVREDNVAITDSMPWAIIRKGALELGRRLADRGQLDRAADVFFLLPDRVEAALRTPGDRVQSLVDRARAEIAWVRAHPGPSTLGPPEGPPPDLRAMPEAVRRTTGALLWMAGVEFGASGRKDPAGDQLAGVGASGGRASGPCRIVRGPEDFHRVQPGDVLVCVTTTPPWSVLFSQIAGLVADGGDVLAHAAIIAREHGIPAVVATGNATRLLKDGQHVVVDGDRGVVAEE